MFTIGNNNVAVGGNHNSITWSGGTVKLGLQAGWNEGITNKVPGAEHNNAWIGWKAGYTNETGGGNVGIGPEALYSVTAGSGHTAIGVRALRNLSASANDGSSTIGIGYWAGRSITSGAKSGSIIIGDLAAQSFTTGSTIAIGYKAVRSQTGFNAQGVIAIGELSLSSIQIGDSKASERDPIMALGNESLSYLKGPRSKVYMNLAIGEWSGRYLGLYNTVHGGTDVSNNLIIGHYAAQQVMYGNQNTVVGHNTLLMPKESAANTAFGYGALQGLTNGFQGFGLGAPPVGNTAIGVGTLSSGGTSVYSIALGYEAGYKNLSGTSNTFIGERAAYYSSRWKLHNQYRSPCSTPICKKT